MKKPIWFRNAVIVLCLLVLMQLACGETPVRHRTTYQVTYSVTGTAKDVSLCYQNAQGGTEQIDSVRTPWKRTIYAKRGQFVYISAQNQADKGSVVCEILIDAKPWKKSTSSGAYVIATCSGSAGED